MIKILSLVYLSSQILLVSSNPLGQLVQSCNVCQPSYSNPSTPVVIQQPSNTNPYSQDSKAQVPTSYSGPLGETLNQIVLNKILSNPSLQKIIDPKTKLYNQNGDEVQRHATSSGGNTPNVINNYFIVPPEFFNLNETISKNNEDITQENKVKSPRRRKLKRKIKKVEPDSTEDEEEEVIRKPGKRLKQNKSDNIKRKRKLIDYRNDSDEIIDELDESQESMLLKELERERNKKKHRIRKKKKEQVPPPPVDESEEVVQELEDLQPITKSRSGKELKRREQTRLKSNSKVHDEEPQEIISEVTKSKVDKDKSKSSDREIEPEVIESPRVRKSKKNKKPSDKKPEDKILGNIEIPTDLSHKVTSENRPTRDSKRNVTKKEQKNANTYKKPPSSNITPFPDDIIKKFFPHMPMGNLYNSNTNYPHNFDKYYQYLNPVRNSNASTKKKRKNKNRQKNDANSNSHTIEIKLKPRKKENNETSVTTEKNEDVHDQSTESIEQVTDIPMEMPYKVSPVKCDIESSSKDSYETFSKLEELHDFITPELEAEDEVLPMYSNGIVNDYYPIFDVDVYYNPYAEEIKNLDDNRYFYETEKEDKMKRERRKLDRYEDTRGTERTNEKEQVDSINKNNGKADPDIKKYDHTEYLDDISTFSEPVVKSDADIRRVKVPPKNTRVKVESVETVSAGSKVAKYGVASDIDDLESSIPEATTDVHNLDEISYSSDGNIAYVVAKSIGHLEDYW